MLLHGLALLLGALFFDDASPGILVVFRDGLGKNGFEVGSVMYLEDGEDASLRLVEERLATGLGIWRRAKHESAPRARQKQVEKRTILRVDPRHKSERNLVRSCSGQLGISRHRDTSELSDDHSQGVVRVRSLAGIDDEGRNNERQIVNVR